MSTKELNTLSRQASQGESISREEAEALLQGLTYTEKLALRELLREMKKAPC